VRARARAFVRFIGYFGDSRVLSGKNDFRRRDALRCTALRIPFIYRRTMQRARATFCRVSRANSVPRPLLALRSVQDALSGYSRSIPRRRPPQIELDKNPRFDESSTSQLFRSVASVIGETISANDKCQVRAARPWRERVPTATRKRLLAS